MFKKTIYLLAILCTLGFWAACEGETEDLTIDLGQDYFPTLINHSVTYQIDSIIYNTFTESVDTNTLQVKEVVVGNGTDLEGRPRTEIARYVRYNTDISWDNIIPRIFYTVRTERVAERVEENQRFVKLTFPPLEGAKWAGNEYLDTEDDFWAVFDDWQYEYEQVGGQESVNGLNFDNTITVLQNDFATLKDRIYGKEIYAKGVGLIYKEFMNLELLAQTLPSIEAIGWPERANDGIHVIWKIIEYESE